MTIPPKYGYGSAGFAVVPPNETLEFELVILAINGNGEDLRLYPKKAEDKTFWMKNWQKYWDDFFRQFPGNLPEWAKEEDAEKESETAKKENPAKSRSKKTKGKKKPGKKSKNKN